MTQNPRPGSPPRNGQAVVNKGSSNNRKMAEDKKMMIMPCKMCPKSTTGSGMASSQRRI